LREHHHRERQDQCEVADLWNHLGVPCALEVNAEESRA
jgi:hypothetical protein